MRKKKNHIISSIVFGGIGGSITTNLIYFSLWLKAEYIKLVVMEPPIPPKTIELII